MPETQRHLEDRLGQKQPLWGDIARVTPPGVQKTSLSPVLLHCSTVTIAKRHKTQITSSHMVNGKRVL